MEALCDSYVRAFEKFKQSGAPVRPFVVLAFTQSLDGCIAKQTGGMRNEVSGENMILRHRFRSMNDGVLVGRGTIATDNPILNVRHFEGKSPQPIILDSQLRSRIDSRVIQECDLKPWFVFGNSVDAERPPAFIAEGCDLIKVSSEGENLSLNETLEQLYSMGIKSLVVEGGASIIESFLSQGLADFVVITISSHFISEPGAQKYNIHSHGRSPMISDISTVTVGDEIVAYGEMAFQEQKIGHMRNQQWPDLRV